MEDYYFSDPFSTTLDTDIRAEVTAAAMVEMGIPAEQIIFLMQGGSQRTYRKEVESISEEISKWDHKEYFVIKTTKEGLYDMLPEGMFHSPGSHHLMSEKEILATIKQRRVEEQNARLFFLPFEAALGSIDLQMALYENAVDKSPQYDELVKMFSADWTIFTYLDKRQANIFLHLLPIVHSLRDDHQTIRAVMEWIIQLPVQIQLMPQGVTKALQPMVSMLDSCTLGVDFTTGNRQYHEGVDEIVISVGPVTGEVCQQYRAGETALTVLELLCDYLLPVEIDVRIAILLQQESRATMLASENNYLNSCLGSDTYL